MVEAIAKRLAFCHDRQEFSASKICAKDFKMVSPVSRGVIGRVLSVKTQAA